MAPFLGLHWDHLPPVVCSGSGTHALCALGLHYLYCLPRLLPSQRWGPKTKARVGTLSDPVRPTVGLFLRDGVRRGQEQDGNILRTPGRRGIQCHRKVKQQRVCLNVSLHCYRETSEGAWKPGLSSGSGSDQVNDPGRPSASRTRSSPIHELVPKTAWKRTNWDQ